MAKGDIVLITFPFTDLSSTKLRPAVVLFESKLDLMVCFITSNTGWQEATDLLLTPDEENGLRKNSIVRTSKIATLDKSFARGLLGKMSREKISELDDKLKLLFQLDNK
ncbi:MAG: type II toxin-antitoxin system PemK/MazF family toxin [Flavisolibacter sp.]